MLIIIGRNRIDQKYQQDKLYVQLTGLFFLEHVILIYSFGKTLLHRLMGHKNTPNHTHTHRCDDSIDRE